MFNSSSEFRERIREKKKRKWRLFRATDFQSLMYPCFIFCRILGIFPYKINTSSYEISKPCYILSTVIKCVMCFYSLIIFYTLNITELLMIFNIRRIIEIVLFNIVNIFIIITTYMLDGPRIRLLQMIQGISLGVPSELYQKQSILIHAKDIFGFLYSFVQTSTYFYFKIPTLFKMFSIYATMIMFQMDMLYMNCVCVLKTCFKKINDDLAKLLVMNNEPHLFSWFYHEQRNPFLLMKLKALQKYHLRVSNTVKMLNMIFSLQILVTTVMTFVKITFSLYFYLLLEKDFDYMNLETRAAYIFYITAIVYYFVKIASIAWVCETGKNQAVEIGITIHDVFNSTNDEEVKNELQLFSLQILHTRQNMFSTKSFTMGAPFLVTLIGSITTYLLVLIQFRNISISCNTNHE